MFHSEDHSQHTIQAAEESYAVLQKFSAESSDTSLDYIEAIAKARYVLSVMAEQMKTGKVNETLAQIVCKMCTDTKINTKIQGKSSTGPLAYLLKLIIRQFGFPCLKYVTQSYPWITSEQVEV